MHLRQPKVWLLRVYIVVFVAIQFTKQGCIRVYSQKTWNIMSVINTLTINIVIAIFYLGNLVQ